MFDIVYSDLWTSPILSISRIKYYKILCHFFLDHYAYFLWINQLRSKYYAFTKLLHFHAYVNNEDYRPALRCGYKYEHISLQFIIQTVHIHLKK